MKIIKLILDEGKVTLRLLLTRRTFEIKLQQKGVITNYFPVS